MLTLWLALVATGAALYGLRPRPETRVDPWPKWVWGAFGLVVLSTVAALALAIQWSAGEQERGPLGLTDAQLRGKAHFTDSCRKCHTLADATAVSTVGPNLDVLQPSRALVVDAVLQGRKRGRGPMPRGLLNETEAIEVADYLAAVAGR